ncbi:EXS family protein [Perilla frutescens var. hirtella]|uniref:EXS family protein n=1 Tax=Perilla frutescens var. hirtella TaxID=608512 RepID=A0AAD4JE42_PERFH|nr:EXS family protein [Perilla frutescens var. hirtella]
MFGGLESVPNNSPHLRKSGSRPVVFDIGSSELGNSSEEDFLLSTQSNEMKGGSTPLSSAAIVPSPLLLWRFKVLLFFLWGFCCCKIGWDSVMRMSADLRDLFLYEAFLYYNPLLLVTMMVWLWGINLWVFAQANIGYVKIFDLDQTHLTHREIWKCATWMTIIVPTSMTAYLYLYSHGEVSLAASQPVLLYAAVSMTLIFPFDIFYLSSRFFFLRTVWRIVFPLQAISFADFFLADIFTSMSKVFSDLERSVCRMVHRQVATIAWFEADSVCGSHSIAIPIVLVLPYIFRFFQCLRQYKDTREKTSLLNALKYSTAVPVIFLSALKYHVFPEKWTNIYRPLWLLSSVFNSLYSFYWDITRDWDLSCFTRIFKFSKPHIVTHLLHGRNWVYIWVIGSNLILRCTWTYKLSAHLRHNYLTVFAITALEMLRRFQWVFFRVENEWNKANSKSNIQLSMTDKPTEEDKLLNSDGHTRENGYLGHGSNSLKIPDSDDLDFNDVFGGPPRRFSMQEVKARYSFGETVESEEETTASSPWGALKEKPVFGEETTPRRRQKGTDFFDDIFKGGEAAHASPRRTDRDSVFGSNPSSRIMSPAKADLLGTSLPAQFSLPAKLTKGMDPPTFGSHNHGQHKVDGGSNGLSSQNSLNSLSRFSNEATRSLDDMVRNEVHPFSRQSPLSNEAFFMNEDSPFNAISDEKDNIEGLKNDTRNVDGIGNQFHFSIYKWAGRGVPMLMPLVIENNLKSKDNMKYEKSASSNGRMERKSSSVKKQGSSAAEPEPLRKEERKQQNHVAEAFYELSKSKSQSIANESVFFDRIVKKEQVKSVDGSNVGEKIEKKLPVKIREGLKFEVRPLHAFLDESDQPRDVAETKDKKTRTPAVHDDDAHSSKKVKEKGRLDSNNAKVEKSNLQGTTQERSAAAQGKVKEFVQIFNQEADSRPKDDVQGNRSSRWGTAGIDQKGNEVSSNPIKVKEQVKLHNVDKKPDVSFKVVEDLNNDEAQRFSPTRSSSRTTTRSSSRLRKSFSAGALHKDLKILPENLDDPLEDNFVVEELSDDGHEDVIQINESSHEDTKAIDAKIRQWSVGKKGNIRSLLSTLQYVLWTESGWKPVPLVDLIESSSVKRAYQKALLRLHPDKLQQKGADFHHKYLAEKVFDILQEAWDHFNTCSSLGI